MQALVTTFRAKATLLEELQKRIGWINISTTRTKGTYLLKCFWLNVRKCFTSMIKRENRFWRIKSIYYYSTTLSLPLSKSKQNLWKWASPLGLQWLTLLLWIIWPQKCPSSQIMLRNPGSLAPSAPERGTLELPIPTVIQSMLTRGSRIGTSCPKAIGIKFRLRGERKVSSYERVEKVVVTPPVTKKPWRLWESKTRNTRGKSRRWREQTVERTMTQTKKTTIMKRVMQSMRLVAVTEIMPRRKVDWLVVGVCCRFSYVLDWNI